MPDAEGARLAAAKAGDEREFSLLTEPYRRELTLHCYRLLGSLQEAEDLVQETLLRAWRRLETFEGRASFRAWLYRIATNACLDVLRKDAKRALPAHALPPSDPRSPFAPPSSEPIWLEPFPDAWLETTAADPAARYEASESIKLAFLAALQLLPPRQRAMLILRDVLDWRAREVADLLGLSKSAVNSALYRARATLSEHYSAGSAPASPAPAADEAERALLARYVQAWEKADVGALMQLLEEEAAFSMPPSSTWYQGRDAIAAGLGASILPPDARGRWRLVPTRANGEPAFGLYQREDPTYRPFAVQVLTPAASRSRLAEITVFLLPELFPRFDLPPELDA